MLTSTVPFIAQTKEDLYKKVVNDEVDYDQLHYSEQSIEVLDLIDQLLSKSRRMRLSAKEALKHIWLEDE